MQEIKCYQKLWLLTISKRCSCWKVYNKGLKEEDVILEIFGGLEGKELDKALNRNVIHFLFLKNLKLIEFAFNHGVDPNIKIWDKNLIFDAIETGVPEIVELFLKADADFSVTFKNQTPLDFAQS